ncbi:MAG: MFS transporter [Alphaproteobacteria bacterium]|nr:MFS transporter [Alphaproteobacteria bacterium]
MEELSLERRTLLARLIMVCVVIMVSSMDIFLPALPQMRDYFGTSEYLLQLTLMIGPLTSAVVGLFFGRLSDTYGRRKIFFISLVFFLTGGLGCCIADTIDSFAWSRLVQSIGTGGISIVAVVIVADMFHGIQYARYMAIYGSLFPITFAISPIVGALSMEYFGWRSCFILNFLAMLSIAVILRVLLPETIRRGDSANLGGMRELLRKGKLLLTDREFVLMALGHALPIGLTGLFLANGSFIFIDGFGMTPSQFSLFQAIPIALNFVGALVYRRFIATLGIRGALRIGIIGFLGFTVAALGLVTQQLPNNPQIILSILCLSNFAMPFIVATCATRAFEIFPDDRGLSVSMVATLRNLSLAIIVSLAGAFFNGTILPVYIAMMLLCLVVLGILVAAMQRPLVFASE